MNKHLMKKGQIRKIKKIKRSKNRWPKIVEKAKEKKKIDSRP